MQKLLALALVLSSCSTSQVFQPAPDRFCAVIGDVKYLKNGKASVQPRGSKYWFRYPTQSIHRGDTVELSLNTRIEPKF